MMNTVSNAPGRNIGALVAMVIAAALVGALALILMGRDGDANTSVNAEPQFSEPALPQGARFPDADTKFAPGRVIQPDLPATEAAHPAPCQGEGLLDGDNRAALESQVDSIDRFCATGAYPAGGPDAGPGEGFPPACRDGKLYPELYAELGESAIHYLIEQCVARADPADVQGEEPLFPTGEGHLDPSNDY